MLASITCLLPQKFFTFDSAVLFLCFVSFVFFTSDLVIASRVEKVSLKELRHDILNYFFEGLNYG